jgi:branched-chain amino acid transport system substrate-binding protein
VNADVAEGYSVGQIVDQAVTANKSLDQSKLISYLHSGATFQSVQGPVKFNSLGENGEAAAFVFQWQHGVETQVLPTAATGSSKVEYPKAPWGG